MEHYIITDSEKNTSKIEKHLSKYINVYSPAWIFSISSNTIATTNFDSLQFPKFSKKVKMYQITTLIISIAFYIQQIPTELLF